MVTNGDSGGHGSDRMFNDVTIVAMDPLARDYINTAHGTNWYAKRRTNTRITTHWLVNYRNHCELIWESCYFHDVLIIFNEYLGVYELPPTCTLFILINVFTYAYVYTSGTIYGNALDEEPFFWQNKDCSFISFFLHFEININNKNDNDDDSTYIKIPHRFR